MSESVLGIDIGGTGIKGAVVDLNTGKFLTKKVKYKTPDVSSPAAVLEIMKQLITDFSWENKPIGVGFPAIIKNGIAMSAANVDKSWKGFDIQAYFSKELEVLVTVVNDADAAGMAEFKFGSANNMPGTVMLLTLGTGIGSALFVDGHLVPNVEMGHLKWKRSIAEDYASNRARKRDKLDWPKFGARLNEILHHISFLMSPDLIIIGGGISKSFEFYKPYIDIEGTIVPASLQNEAGIIGAAIYSSFDKSLIRKSL